GMKNVDFSSMERRYLRILGTPTRASYPPNDMVTRRSTFFTSCAIQALSESTSKELKTAQRLPTGHATSGAGAARFAGRGGTFGINDIQLSLCISREVFERPSSAASNATSVSPTRIVETAVSEGSSSNLTASQIRFGKVVAPGPPRNSAKTTSSKEVKKAKAPAEIRAGRTAGNDTYQNARRNEAPQARAASSTAASSCRKAAPTMTITTGKASN